MGKKVTSRRVATEAGKLLRKKETPVRINTVAGSALSQREKKRR